MKPGTEHYLGDAVYASFDGYQIWLRTGDGNNQRIALEPEVYRALVDFHALIVERAPRPSPADAGRNE